MVCSLALAACSGDEKKTGDWGGSGGNVKTANGSDVNYDTLVSSYEQALPAARTALNAYLDTLEAIENGSIKAS